MEKSEKNGSQVVNMVILLLCVCMQIIEVILHDMFDVMEIVGHNALKSSVSIH